MKIWSKRTFFVCGKMFMHIHGHGHCDIRLAKEDQGRILVEGKARPHRWAPEKGYVTFMARTENDLAPAMELIRMSRSFWKGNVKRAQKSRLRNRKTDAGRQQIVASARAHFFSHGFRSVTMDDLAEELGISKKTLYAHFPSKIELLEAVLADKFANVEAKLNAITRAHPHDFSRALHELLANTQRELDEIKPPFVRDMRQKAPQVFK